MRILVFGANGKVGNLLVAELLQRGYFVRAFVHGKSDFSTAKNLEIFQGDVYEHESVVDAMKDIEVVISTLGSWGTKKKNVLSVGMQNIIPAMQTRKINRIISLTGADCNAHGDKPNLIHNISRALFSVVAAKILRDGENHIDQLTNSGLDWTVVRSPVMNETGDPAAYTLTNERPRPWQTIHRQSVARAMIDVLESPDYNRQSPFITRH